VLFPFVVSISPDGAPHHRDLSGLPRLAFVMASSADDCWKLAGECGRWADEAQGTDTRLAFVRWRRSVHSSRSGSISSHPHRTTMLHLRVAKFVVTVSLPLHDASTKELSYPQGQLSHAGL
jgi:hypothetical protein